TGPITGIYSCLKQSTSHSVFIMTCDMPFIEKDLVRHICEHYMKKLNANINYDAVIPKYNNTVEPLLGIYSKGSLLKMQRAIESEKVMMKRFLEEINTLYIDLSNIIDKNELWRLSFENINTLDDFDRYRDKGLELTI
ncbi:MAG: molybdenum cofactor guanylyltransferase, partial [Thermodesulfovibrionales bacterium]|nr:molybdenum cofactor guanylyltransferase [Thermodesulfovibrionales bacterium]